MDPAFEGTDRIFRIALTPKADRSTFLHESAHVFLELFGDLAARADAPESVRRDWDITLKWLGVASKEDIKTEHHEKWAETFEAYLAKGEYPSSKLAGAFQRFRLWMGAVYKRITQLGTVSPDIAGVFDRLLATDREIEATKRSMGLKAMPRELLGLSVEDYAAHLDALAEAESEAQHRLDAQVARDKARATEAWWKAQMKEYRKSAAEAYEALPARRAELILQGKGTDEFLGITVALARAPVEAWLGKKAAQKFHLAKDGMHPDEVAEAYGNALGYGTGKDLVQAVAQLPAKDDYVEAEAERRMAEEHPGVLDERQRLRELAQAAMHGEKSKAAIMREWAALTARGSKTAPRLPPSAVLKRAAELLVAGRPAGELGLHEALVAERSAANQALKAALAGNAAQAIAFKQKQLLAMHTYDALREAKKEVEDFEELTDKLSRLPARQRLGKGHPTYRDAVDMLLSVLGIAEPRESVRGSVDALLLQVEQLMADNGDTVGFDRERVVDRLEQLGTKGWKAIPLEDLRHVVRTLENITAAARNRSEVLAEQKRIDKEQAIEELATEADALEQRPEEPTTEAETFGERMGRWWTEFDGGLLKVERMAEWLSGSKDTAGFVRSAWFRYVVEPMQAAKARKADLYRQHVEPLVKAFEAIPSETKERWEELLPSGLFPEHIDEKRPRRRWEVLMLLLHSGNESNLARLTEGRNITEQQLREAAIAVEVTADEYQWIQSVWDAAESLKPLAFQLEEEDSGVRPEAIPAKPFVTPHGLVRGGYFPAVYDRITQVGEAQEVTMAGLVDKSYTRPGTSRSFLKKRAEGFSDIISLSPASIYRHFNQVTHDIAFRRAVKSVGSLLLDRRVQGVLRQKLGSGRAQQFKVWLQDVARGRGAAANDGLGFLANLASTVRGNVVVSALGFQLRNALEDATSNLVSALTDGGLKPGHLMAGLSEFASNPGAVRAAALEKSAELRARAGTTQRELGQQVEKLTQTKLGRLVTAGPLGWLKEHAFIFQETAEAATATPVWLGAYRQAIQLELSEKEAVAYADATLRKAFPSHNLVDLSTILRNKGVVGQLLMFHGAFNHFYNQFRSLGRQVVGAESTAERTAASARALGLAAGLFLLGAIVRGQGPDKGEPLEDWLIRKLALEGFAQLVPGLGEVGNILASVQRGKPTTARNNSLVGVAGSIAESVLKAADSEKDTSKRVKAALGLLGPTLGVPVAAPVRSGGPLADWVMGGNEWRNPLDAASDLVYGRTEDAPFNALQGAADLVEGGAR